MINIKALYQNRDLLWLWTQRVIKVRYKQSALGIIWAILQPLSLMLLFTLVFSFFVRVPTEGFPYPVFSYCALLPWTFFASSVSLGISSLTNNITLVTKIYFPREILPIAVVLACLFDYFIGFVVFIFMLIVYSIPLNFNIFLMLPIISIQIILTLGIVILASAINVFFRDIQFVVPLGLQLLMFASPIVYPISSIPEKWQWVFLLNPMAVFIEAYRSILLRGSFPDWAMVLQATFISVIILIIGYSFFKRVEWQFADII